jgi:hypothetical protein
MKATPRRALCAIAFALLVFPTTATVARDGGASAPAMPNGSAPDRRAHAPHGLRAGGSMTGMPAAAAADVASPQAIVSAYYASLSGPAGKKRDWNRFLSLFFPGARLLPAEGKGHSGTMPHLFSPQTYLFNVEPNMLKEGFIETEIAQRRAGVGKILQVLSTYEVRHAAGEAKPFVRGINGFQLYFDGQRWWIVSVVWQPETSQLKLPDEYLR